MQITVSERGNVSKVELVFDKTFDDHIRPRYRLWQRFHFPQTQYGLYLYQDGRVIETDTWFTDGYVAADDRAQGGIINIYEDTDWQVQVLTDAGYTLVPYTG
jgi:hypothetical protein